MKIKRLLMPIQVKYGIGRQKAILIGMANALILCAVGGTIGVILGLAIKYISK